MLIDHINESGTILEELGSFRIVRVSGFGEYLLLNNTVLAERQIYSKRKLVIGKWIENWLKKEDKVINSYGNQAEKLQNLIVSKRILRASVSTELDSHSKVLHSSAD